MFQSPQQHSTSEGRRKQCVRSLSPDIALIVDKAQMAGWSREEVLIAIADVADQQLADLTGTAMTTVGGHADPMTDILDEPVQKRLSMPASGAFLLG